MSAPGPTELAVAMGMVALGRRVAIYVPFETDMRKFWERVLATLPRHGTGWSVRPATAKVEHESGGIAWICHTEERVSGLELHHVFGEMMLEEGGPRERFISRARLPLP